VGSGARGRCRHVGQEAGHVVLGRHAATSRRGPRPCRGAAGTRSAAAASAAAEASRLPRFRRAAARTAGGAARRPSRAIIATAVATRVATPAAAPAPGRAGESSAPAARRYREDFSFDEDFSCAWHEFLTPGKKYSRSRLCSWADRRDPTSRERTHASPVPLAK
jgi:hypothetical protein